MNYTLNRQSAYARLGDTTTLARADANHTLDTTHHLTTKRSMSNEQLPYRAGDKIGVVNSIVKNEVLRVQQVAGTLERARKGRQERAERA